MCALRPCRDWLCDVESLRGSGGGAPVGRSPEHFEGCESKRGAISLSLCLIRDGGIGGGVPEAEERLTGTFALPGWFGEEPEGGHAGTLCRSGDGVRSRARLGMENR